MEQPQAAPQENFTSFFIDTLINFAIAVILFVLIYVLVAVPHKVDGSSMLPSFFHGDYLLTEKVTRLWDDYDYGESIVFYYPKDTSKRFIKRVIALPHDTIKLSQGMVYINDLPLDEPYIKGDPTTGHRFLSEDETYTLGDHEYFVMGDNRSGSSDSREWGPVSRDLIVGKVFFRYWPLSRLGLIERF
ncbi:signal peptidase I [candidate division WWE3 bacterium CG_4_9_14_3_um_filter_39_7]|uniref:Signal peptidase I n=1 Tax=candidate division WWE3 bacterium CG_4_9_14_3_um_filter_39_7 TaxID=1975080 RepID=A0A2M7X1M0_UNCKA|nr:MAG: signal peptidase I [candidate division WWE3 bacterium CG_4_9_14_3_um_filter_39_7]